MENVFLIFVLVAILAAATLYIVKAKKKGVKCIGCPAGAKCIGKCSGEACTPCSCHTEE